MPRIKINTASLSELTAVRGIGKKTAERIIAARDAGTNIGSSDELFKLVKVNPAWRPSIIEAFEFVEPRFGGEWTFEPAGDRPGIGPIFVPKYPEFRFSGELYHGSEGNYEGWRVEVSYATRFRGYRRMTLDVKPDGTFAFLARRMSQQPVTPAFEFTVCDAQGQIHARHSATVEDQGHVRILIPEQGKDETILIEVKKPANVNFADFLLNWSVSRCVGAETLAPETGQIELARNNTASLSVKSPRQFTTLTVNILSKRGFPILSRTVEFRDLAPEDSTTTNHDVRKLVLELEQPQITNYVVQLDDSFSAHVNPYREHKIAVKFDVLDPETLNVLWRGTETFPVEHDPANGVGQSQIQLKHYGLVNTVEFSILSPTGETLSTRRGQASDFAEMDPVIVSVPPRELIDPGGFVKYPDRPDKALCRLLDPSGQRIYSDIQVIFYGKRTGAPADEAPEPFLATRSENNGYFIIDLPPHSFEEAFARIGVSHDMRTWVDVPIGLDRAPVQRVERAQDADAVHTVITSEEGFLPGKMVLVVIGDPNDESDSSCDDCAGRFDKNRAVLEEFTYHSVVRTTEPSIQGYTLEEDGEVAVTDVIDALPELNANVDNALPSSYLNSKVRKDILLHHSNRRKGLTRATLIKAIEESRAVALRESIGPRRQVRAVGRQTLSDEVTIDWDDEPTIYQATSLAHGHLLSFKQEWISDGYSLGDIIYSLPLAPGQKKQLVVLDWEQRATGNRSERFDYSESLENELGRDRDVNEIVTGVLRESQRGGSTARTSAIGFGAAAGGIGTGVGGLIGVAGGASKASSTAWQNNARSTALNSAHALRDRTTQTANAVRSQRATVIEATTQGEQFSVQTESVANYNHCHAMTVQYFEVLRHFRVEQRLSGVQECLFVPLIVTPFSFEKVLRWRESLAANLQNSRLRSGFSAIQRIENNYDGSDLPEGRYSDADLISVDGHLDIEFRIGTPLDIIDADKTENVRTALQRWSWIFPNVMEWVERFQRSDAENRHRLFMEVVAPELAMALVENLRFFAQVQDSSDAQERSQELPIDVTLVSRFRNDRPLRVSLRQSAPMPGLKRSAIRAIEVSKVASIKLGNADQGTVLDRLPADSNILIRSGTLNYQTDYATGRLFSSSRINDDLLDYGADGNGLENGAVRIATPLTRAELRNPREEDVERANALRDHLNDNMEYYHQSLWADMDPSRRFMFLDGIRVTDYSEADRFPEGVVRSVASVVENRVIGVVGNSLVMPVAPGFRLDPNIQGRDVDLLSLYRPATPIEPMRLSLPTKGVFAEAVLGHCNSCEQIEDNRFWRWSEEPIPDSPTQIAPVSTVSRVGDAPDTTPTPLSAPVVNVQNAPAAPDPTGIGAALQLLANPDVFRNITGLSQNQKNAIQALQSSLSTADSFGGKAASLTALAAKLDAIEKARRKNLMPADKAQEEVANAFNEANAAAARVAEAETAGIAHDVASAVVGNAKDAARVKLRMERNGDSESAEVEVDRRVPGEHHGGGTDNANGALYATGGTRAPGTIDPVQAELMKHLLERRAEAFVAESLQRIDTRIASAVSEGNKELAFWAADPADPEGPRIVESDGGENSHHSRKQEIQDKLYDYITSARPGLSEQDRRTHAREYASNKSPWSASFISHLFRSAGWTEAQGFAFYNGHNRYIRQALCNRLNRDYLKPFWLFRPDEVELEVGDIVGAPRAGFANDFSFTTSFFGTPDGLPMIRRKNGVWETGEGEFASHTDMVLRLEDRTSDAPADTVAKLQNALVIGGNTAHLDLAGGHTCGLKKVQMRNGVIDDTSVDFVIKILRQEHFEEWLTLQKSKISSELVDRIRVDAVLEPIRRNSLLEVFGTSVGNRRVLPQELVELLDDNRSLILPDEGETPIESIDFGTDPRPEVSLLPPDVA
ncbi:helix-hairpin-helix domain-containing protein [Marinobacter daepoensis]|uniref:Helix-hairpin-helix domain-containing protein n=1 Tax=Marinobacter daepoensis TaxID=262077 RepID=A0ABS3BBR1_9GAMM|nr:helix-hairpin-helix domain-containing protein [Marinobacter daepoensis]MBN7769291.1 helix-hairpin-helix domain-containing protein [Marinobacter daepoensis]MBY6077981.1 helix-hairpin-helix domain-containing protein [Marinobacter daepoensis]